MKKITLLLVGLLCGFIANKTFAQTNLNFEQWSGTEPNGWESSNAQTMQNGGVQTVFKETTSPGQGIASIKMVTGSCPSCPNFSILGPFGPPTPLPNPLGGSIQVVATYSQRPISVDFKYKSNPIGNDAGGFDVQLTKYNPVSGETEIIGEGYFEAGTQVTNWTNMNIPIVYYSNLIPDTINFWATSSIGSIPDLSSLGIPMVFPVPTPVANSEFYLDAININLPSCAGFGLSVTGTNETTPTSVDGTATANPSGGTPPYAYTWSNLATTPSINGLPFGLYYVTVTDANGCAKVGSYNVLPFSCGAFSVSVTGTEATSFTAQDGTASATVTGGTGPYTYLWNTGDVTATISGLRLGTYVVEVTDASGTCVAWGYFPSNSSNGVNDFSIDHSIVVYPNPSNGIFALKSENRISKIEIVNMLGEKVYVTSAINNQSLSIDVSSQPNGVYFLQIKNGKEIFTKKIVIQK